MGNSFGLMIIGLLLVGPVLEARVQPRTRHRKAPTSRTSPNSDPALVNDPKVADPISTGAKGSAVVRAQILLDRAGFSSGEIDGNFGKNLQNTVAAFQTSRGLNEHGPIGHVDVDDVVDTSSGLPDIDAQGPRHELVDGGIRRVNV